MNAELPVTQATLDAAVLAGARARFEAVAGGLRTTWEQLPDSIQGDYLDLARTVLTAALPVLAAAIEQARADERERLRAAITGRLDKLRLAPEREPGMRFVLAMLVRMDEHAIARAGTSGGDRG